MSFCTVNGHTVTAAVIGLPRTGRWQGRLAIDSEEPILGKLTIQLGEVTLAGFGRAAGRETGTLWVHAVGGNGGLQNEIAARSYRDPIVEIVLRDIVQDAGETLSSRSSAAVLRSGLPYWVRSRGPAAGAIAAILSGRANWRVLADGSIWAGAEEWKNTAADREILSFDRAANRMDILTMDAQIFPGEMIDGQRVSYVEHQLQPDSFTSTLWLE